MTNYAVKISEQGQITLPKDLRNRIGVTAGNRVILTVSEDSNVVAVNNKFPIESYFGKFDKTIAGGDDPAKFIRNIRDQVSAKHAGKS